MKASFTHVYQCLRVWVSLTCGCVCMLTVLWSRTGRQWTQSKTCKDQMLPQNTTVRILFFRRHWPIKRQCSHTHSRPRKEAWGWGAWCYVLCCRMNDGTTSAGFLCPLQTILLRSFQVLSSTALHTWLNPFNSKCSVTEMLPVSHGRWSRDIPQRGTEGLVINSPPPQHFFTSKLVYWHQGLFCFPPEAVCCKFSLNTFDLDQWHLVLSLHEAHKSFKRWMTYFLFVSHLFTETLSSNGFSALPL